MSLLEHDFHFNERGTYLKYLHVYLSEVHFLDNNSIVICLPFPCVYVIF